MQAQPRAQLAQPSGADKVRAPKEASLIYSVDQPKRYSGDYYCAANIGSLRSITYITIMKFAFKLLIFTSIAVSSLHAGEEGFVSLFDGETLNGWKAARSTGEGDSGAFSVNKDEKAIHVYAGQEHGSKQKSDCLNTCLLYTSPSPRDRG